MSSDADAVSFVEPSKQIKSVGDLKVWASSQAFQYLIDFLVNVNSTLGGRCVQSVTSPSPPTDDVITGLVSLLDRLDSMADKVEPLQQAQRFGNRAFTTLHQNISQSACQMLRDVLPASIAAAAVELAPYLCQSLGDPQRIDYGTGHEMAFVMLLCCLWRLNAFSGNSLPHVALTVMYRYLKLVQKLQLRYCMEPAGSHGVWSLDDHQFIPYYWGSGQLLQPLELPASTAGLSAALDPSCIADRSRVCQLADSCLMFDCIRHIHSVKTGPFAEHSSVLYSMCSVASWQKINSGLLKMYKAEVLAKFPVVQHCLFGSILSLTPAVTQRHYLPLTGR